MFKRCSSLLDHSTGNGARDKTKLMFFVNETHLHKKVVEIAHLWRAPLLDICADPVMTFLLIKLPCV